MSHPPAHHPRQDTPAKTPLLSLILGYGPMACLPLIAIGAWLGIPHALALGQLLAAALLLFFAGVARGLSFFTEGGPRFGQVAMTLLRFALGFAAMIVPATLAFPLLALGYASIALYDPHAAKTGAAPRYFASLRPRQMVIALAGITAMFAYAPGR